MTPDGGPPFSAIHFAVRLQCAFPGYLPLGGGGRSGLAIGLGILLGSDAKENDYVGERKRASRMGLFGECSLRNPEFEWPGYAKSDSVPSESSYYQRAYNLLAVVRRAEWNNQDKRDE